MFNLEQAIIEWRQQLAANGFNSREALDELESHLRDAIEQRMDAGVSAQQAFKSATQQIGKAEAIRSEYGKLVKRFELRNFWSVALAMRRFRPAILVINFILAALLSPDAVTQAIGFVILQLLCEGGIWIARRKECGMAKIA